MRTIFRELVLILIALSPVVGALIVYHRLPETMATHFGVNNEVNGTMSRPAAVSMFAVIGLVPFLLFAMRKVDPRFVHAPKFTIAFHIFRFCTAIVVSTVGWVIVIYNLGHTVDVRRFAFLLLAAMFLVVGNYLPVMKPSFTMGIRTPWTLTNDENWRRTHRLGGSAMVIGGLLLLAAAFLPTAVSIAVFIAALALIVLLPLGYSFCHFRRKRG